MTLDEITSRAETLGIDLGKNSARTIRFYISKGLLESPEIVYIGKVKQAKYSINHLSRLWLISEYKKKGFALIKMKEIMKGSVYLSDKGFEFIDMMRKINNIPDNAFQKGMPITREECAFIFANLIEARKNKKINMESIASFFKQAFLNEEGEPLTEIEQLLT